MTKPGQGFAKRVTLATIQLFAPLLESAGRRRRRQGGSPQTGDAAPELRAARELFRGNPIGYRSEFRRARRPALRGESSPTIAPEQMDSSSPGGSQVVELCWEKANLKRTDALITAGKTTHPVGGLRLTKAHYRVDGELIDQTTYFRDQVFGSLDWGKVASNPDRFRATASFEIEILGENVGVHSLDISHKPTGEAGQGNYTTQIHWGPLAPKIREANILGRTLRLYRPVDGDGPFRIEIL